MHPPQFNNRVALSSCNRPGNVHASQLAGNLLRGQTLTQHMSHQLEVLALQQQLAHRSTNLAACLHLLLSCACRVTTTNISVAANLTTDGRRGSVDQAGNLAKTGALGMADLNSGAFFNAEFGITHRGSTVMERSGVALSFCRRPGRFNCVTSADVTSALMSHTLM